LKDACIIKRGVCVAGLGRIIQRILNTKTIIFPKFDTPSHHSVAHRGHTAARFGGEWQKNEAAAEPHPTGPPVKEFGFDTFTVMALTPPPP